MSLSKYKLYQYLDKYHTKYLSEHKLLLNHPVIIKYLFNKPVIKSKKYLLRECRDIYCSMTESQEIQAIMMALIKYSEDYQKISKQLRLQLINSSISLNDQQKV